MSQKQHADARYMMLDSSFGLALQNQSFHQASCIKQQHVAVVTLSAALPAAIFESATATYCDAAQLVKYLGNRS
jgi:hypothetical protein